MAVRVGLRSTDILLTDAGKKWFLEAYKKGSVYEYHEDDPFELMSLGEGFVEVICPLGIPYIFPIYVDDEITFQMADQEEEKPRHGAVEAGSVWSLRGREVPTAHMGRKQEGITLSEEEKKPEEKPEEEEPEEEELEEEEEDEDEEPEEEE